MCTVMVTVSRWGPASSGGKAAIWRLTWMKSVCPYPDVFVGKFVCTQEPSRHFQPRLMMPEGTAGAQ